MNNTANRKRMIWAAAIGGVLLLALLFITTFAPSTATTAAPVVRPDGGSATAHDLTAASPAASPATGGSGFSLGGGQLASLAWRLALVVVIIAGSIVALRWWGRKTAGPRSASGFIRVIDTLAISNGRTIHLVAMGDRVIAIGATAQQLTFLNELTDDESAGVLASASKPAEQPLATFATELFQSMRRGGISLRRDSAADVEHAR